MLFLITVFLLLLLLISYTTIQKHLALRNKNVPPGPCGFPLIGYLPFLNLNALHESFAQIAKVYGDIFSVRIGTRLAVVVNNHRTIKNALNKSEFAGRPQVFPLTYFPEGNYGVIASTGALWSEQRRFVLRQMKELGWGKTRMEDLIQDDIDTVIRYLKENKANTGEPHNVESMLNLAVVSSTWTILSGQKMSLTDPWFTRMSDGCSYAVPEFLGKGAYAVFFPTLTRLLPKRFLLTNNYISLAKILHQRTREVIAEHKSTFDANNIRDFIDAYLNEMRIKHEKKIGDDWKYYSEWQLQVLIGDMFVASVDTTPTSIRWGILFLAAHPDVQTRCQKELDDVVGKERPVAYQDKSSLPYIEAVISETQRLAAISPLGIVHECQEGTVDGYHVPQDTIIIANIFGTLHDPKSWKHPEEFYPEHFLDDNGQYDSSNEAFMPFATGKRYCIGEGIARMELFLFIASFLQTFSWRLEPGMRTEWLKSPKGKEQTRGVPDYRLIIDTR